MFALESWVRCLETSRAFLQDEFECPPMVGVKRTLNTFIKDTAAMYAPTKAVGELPWREAGLPNHHDDKVDSDQ